MYFFHPSAVPAFTYGRSTPPNIFLHDISLLQFFIKPFRIYSDPQKKRKKNPNFLLSFFHHYRLMLKVCLLIVCNYACLHTEALLCVKVWKPFVAWGWEGETEQAGEGALKQLQTTRGLMASRAASDRAADGGNVRLKSAFSFGAMTFPVPATKCKCFSDKMKGLVMTGAV